MESKASRLEITLKEGLFDAEAENIRQKAISLGIPVEDVKKINVLNIVGDFSREQLEEYKAWMTKEITQRSSYEPILRKKDFHYILFEGLKAGAKDNPGDVALEELVDIIGNSSKGEAKVFCSTVYALKGESITKEQAESLGEATTNDIIQGYKVIHNSDYDEEKGIEPYTPQVVLQPKEREEYTIDQINFEFLKTLSDKESIGLHEKDIPIIVEYFNDTEVRRKRKENGLDEIVTRTEIEYVAQARSDHCNHNTFRGNFHYKDRESGEEFTIKNLFKTTISEPAKRLALARDDIISILDDNAGVVAINNKKAYVATSETHNSPSNMEAYGGAITGIVGVYRDPMGTGLGSKLIMGAYGFCVGPQNWNDEFQPRLHPRDLYDGIIEGVKDGGNKSGIPTGFGFSYFHPRYLGKAAVFVTALGIMDRTINGVEGHKKRIDPGDLIVMCGGRVGMDGIHGVTASSHGLDDKTPAGHVQIGDPYTQKKMHDMLNEAREEGLVYFITDNGGGGLSSSIGEASRLENTLGFSGAEVNLDMVPTKYDGMQGWQKWISESQERMTVGVAPENMVRFMELSKKHGVESTILGRFNNSGALKILDGEKTEAYIDTDFFEKRFPAWEFNAEWQSPRSRLKEPKDIVVKDYNGVLERMLQRENIASKEFIARQYDSEVQGRTVVGPLVGIGDDLPNDIPSDGCVIRPDLKGKEGIAFTQVVLPEYSQIDTKDMTDAVIDLAIRKNLAVGGKLESIVGMDNFCWPTIDESIVGEVGKYRAAQLARSCLALKNASEVYGSVLVSGKDSMYMIGELKNKNGEGQKVPSLPTLQYTAISVLDDYHDHFTCDAKESENLIYVVGTTKNELGGGEFYAMNNKVGLNSPKTDHVKNSQLYSRFEVARTWCESIKAVERGGIAVSAVMMAGGGNMGAEIQLNKLITDDVDNDYEALFSESTGRFMVEVSPENKEAFERAMGKYASCVGRFTQSTGFIVNGLSGEKIIDHETMKLKRIWKEPFGHRNYIMPNQGGKE